MKKILLAVSTIVFFALPAAAQQPGTGKVSDSTVQIVEASCGECQFGMKGKDCELAVRIDGKPYFVDGTSIDDHGDAHATDGFCQAVRKAEVKGEVVDGRFKVSYFKLLPQAAAKKP